MGSRVVTGTAIQCSREAESHRGGLRMVRGEWVCEQCWALENGRELKKGAGRPVLCPWCGEELMTRHRGGGISIKSLSTRGQKAVLTCECGYEKTIKNPFGGTRDRNEAARQRLQSEARRKKIALRKDQKDEGTNQNPGSST